MQPPLPIQIPANAGAAVGSAGISEVAQPYLSSPRNRFTDAFQRSVNDWYRNERDAPLGAVWLEMYLSPARAHKREQIELNQQRCRCRIMRIETLLNAVGLVD